MRSNQRRNMATLCRMAARSAMIVILIGAPTFFARQASSASESIFIRFVGGKTAIEGTAKDSAHTGWISAVSISAGDLNGDAAADRENIGSQSSGAGAGKVNTASSGGGAGKVSTKEPAGRDVATGQTSGKRMHKPFVITREIDKASPILMRACATGEHFSAADVDIVENGRTIHYKMTDVLISAIGKAGGGDRPMESVSFVYQKIEMTK